MNGRRITAGAGAAIVTLVLGSGCNAILGNEEGKLRAALDGGGTTTGEASVPAEAATDAGGTVEAGPPPDGGISCSDGRKLCVQYQACIEHNDPNFGCGSPECKACDTTNASAVQCKPGPSSIDCSPTCNAGYKNCDGKDGCETDLSLSTSCGDCGVTCGGATPLCSKNPSTGLYACVSSCPTGQQQCAGSTQCVDVQTDPDHCGSCSAAPCASTPNGRATCSAGSCGIECNLLFHKCGNVCVADSSATQCGNACVDCTTKSPTNATGGICEGGACKWTACAYGWDDCNGDLAKGLDGDGCETDVLYDMNNCGNCGLSCGGVVWLGSPRYYIPPPGGQQCCNGQCVSDTLLCASSR